MYYGNIGGTPSDSTFARSIYSNNLQKNDSTKTSNEELLDGLKNNMQDLFNKSEVSTLKKKEAKLEAKKWWDKAQGNTPEQKQDILRDKRQEEALRTLFSSNSD